MWKAVDIFSSIQCKDSHGNSCSIEREVDGEWPLLVEVV